MSLFQSLNKSDLKAGITEPSQKAYKPEVPQLDATLLQNVG